MANEVEIFSANVKIIGIFFGEIFVHVFDHFLIRLFEGLLKNFENSLYSQVTNLSNM